MKKLAILILVAVVVLASGCTSSTPVKADEKTKKEIADVVAIGDIRTLPSSPIYTGRTFRMYITVKNLDKEKTINNVNVEIFDPSIFRPASSSKYVGDILPLGEKVVDFDLTAPEASVIANVETESAINFRVTYDFESVATYDVIVVSEDEIEKQMKAGTSIYLLSNKIIGSGPLRIYPELLGSEKGYMISGNSALLGITLKNEGSGIVQNNRVETGMLSVEFPADFEVSAPEFPTYETGNFIATGMASYTCPNGKTIYYGDICGSDVDASCCCANCSAYTKGDWKFYGSFGSRYDCTSSCPDLCRKQGTLVSWTCCGCTGSCSSQGASVCPQGDSDCYCVVEAKTGTTGKTTTSSTTTTVPIHVKPPSETIKKYFMCSSDNLCMNSINPIELVGKESVPFRFEINSPETEVYKTYTVYAGVKYTYELRGLAKVTVRAPEIQ